MLFDAGHFAEGAVEPIGHEHRIVTESGGAARRPHQSAVDACLDLDGFKNTLKLRAAIEGSEPQSPDKYLDLSYYERALKGL